MKTNWKFLSVFGGAVLFAAVVLWLVPLQPVWNKILALLPDQEPDTAASIAGWLQGFATIIALYFTYQALVVTGSEAQASNAALNQQRQAAIEQTRPHVVVDYVQHPNNNTGASYYANNFGPGSALNVYVVADPTSDATTFTALGGLLHGERERVHTALRNAFAHQAANPLDRTPVYLVAQPVSGDEWMLSINRMQADNRIVHEVLPWKPSDAMLTRLKGLTIDERLRQRLGQMRQADTGN
jgi:hypothetical protein